MTEERKEKQRYFIKSSISAALTLRKFATFKKNCDILMRELDEASKLWDSKPSSSEKGDRLFAGMVVKYCAIMSRRLSGEAPLTQVEANKLYEWAADGVAIQKISEYPFPKRYVPGQGLTEDVDDTTSHAIVPDSPLIGKRARTEAAVKNRRRGRGLTTN